MRILRLYQERTSPGLGVILITTLPASPGCGVEAISFGETTDAEVVRLAVVGAPCRTCVLLGLTARQELHFRSRARRSSSAYLRRSPDAMAMPSLRRRATGEAGAINPAHRMLLYPGGEAGHRGCGV